MAIHTQTQAAENTVSKRQAVLGQYLTPQPVADFMSTLFGPFPPLIRLLDAGAGAGALTHAFVQRVCRERLAKRIEVTAWEVDATILPRLEASLDECQQLCCQHGIEFARDVSNGDFIQEISALVSDRLFSEPPPAFEAAIVNPPYRKITADSSERRALRMAGIETSNLYTGFIALIQRLLAPGGQLVAITPRSFCNGPYFNRFRKDFLRSLELHRIHVFDSRKAAFLSDSVLQENVIVHTVKGNNQPAEVIISSSSGAPGDPICEMKVPTSEVIHPRDAAKFIHIPSAPSHVLAKDLLSRLSASLASLGLTVSTGRVVDFRLRASIRQLPEEGSAPLIYPGHFECGVVHWPKPDGRKPNAILDNDSTRTWLVPSGYYVLTKRFTAKEERRRVVACVFDPTVVDAQRLGFENHVNYFHAGGAGLDRDLAVGLYVYLNSTAIDQYFRRFSGHTQVNATDLRNLPYPSREALCAVGSATNKLDLAQDAIDSSIAQHLHGD